MIIKYCKKLKYIRRIILVTDARGSIDGDGIQDIIQKIKDEAIQLIVVYVEAVLQEACLLTSIGELILMTPSMASRKRKKTFKRSLTENFHCIMS